MEVTVSISIKSNWVKFVLIGVALVSCQAVNSKIKTHNQINQAFDYQNIDNYLISSKLSK